MHMSEICQQVIRKLGLSRFVGNSYLIPLCQSWPSFGRSWAGMWDARPQHCRRSGYSSVDIEVPTNNEVSRITGEHIVEQLFA